MPSRSPPRCPLVAFGAAWLAWRSSRGSGLTGEGGRRDAAGRLLVLGSVVFALAVVGAGGWALYLSVMEEYPAVRAWVLRSEKAYPVFNPAVSPHAQREQAAGNLTTVPRSPVFDVRPLRRGGSGLH